MTDEVFVSPDEQNPTHHISLSIGAETVGLILCDRSGNPTGLGIKEIPVPRTVTRVSQGAGGYSDFEYPFTPISQTEWIGGRGAEDFESDTTRFADSFQVDTSSGALSNGPHLFPSDVHTTFNTQYGGTTSDYMIGVGTVLIDFVPDKSFSAKSVLVYGQGAEMVIIYADSGDAPNYSSELARAYMDNDDGPGPTNLYFLSPFSMTSGVKYWASIAVDNFYSYNFTGRMLNGVINKTMKLVFSSAGAGNLRFFEYRGSMMAISQPDDFSAPKLYINGEHGMAASNSADKRYLNISGYTFSDYTNFDYNDYQNIFVKIIGGPGVAEAKNYRKYAQYMSTTQLKLDKTWNEAHTTATEFAIVGMKLWREITGHPLTRPVTDVLVVDDQIYFAQGDDYVIVRGKYNLAGSMDAAGNWSWKSETAKGTHLALATDSYGKRKIWRALAVASTISESDPPAWASSLSLNATEIVADNTNGKITNIIPYDKGLYVIKEDQIGSIVNRVYSRIPLDEMRTVASANNGLSAIQHDVYMYFSLGNGLQKYYQGRLDNMGPDKDNGLPQSRVIYQQRTRNGPVSSMVGMPGKIFAAINAGDTGSSCIMVHNGVGWHEIYRNTSNLRISDIYIQTIPESCSRLWMNLDQNIGFLHVTADDPNNHSDYVGFSEPDPYIDEKVAPYFESAWIYGSMKDIVKYWSSIKVFADDGAGYIGLEYKVDDETDWTAVTGYMLGSYHEFNLGDHNVTGRRLKYRLVSNSGVGTAIFDKVKAIVIDTVTRIPPKLSWQLTFYLADVATNLTQDALQQTASEMTAKLRAFSDSRQYPAPLRMRFLHGAFDDKFVFVEPASISPIELVLGPDREIKLIGSITLQEA